MEEEDHESSSTLILRRPMEEGFHDFFVQNYSLCRGIGIGKAIESSDFKLGGSTWSICFYPDGKDANVLKEGYVSLYIFLKSERVACSRFAYDLYLIDQSGKFNHQIYKGGKLMNINDFCRGYGFGSPRFVKQQMILGNSDYIRSGCIKFRCIMRFLWFDVRDRGVIGVPQSDMGADLGKLLEKKQDTDVFSDVGDERFYGHKWILVARCPFFRTRLPNAHGNEFVIHDIEPRIFKIWCTRMGTTTSGKTAHHY